MTNDPDDILGRVSHLKDGDSSRDIYDDWSATYDNHLLDQFGYISPGVAAEALRDRLVESNIPIIDYGCGTGLVGQALAQQGFTTIDGIDIAEGMLDQARTKQVYRSLICGDLTTRLTLDDQIYDAAACVGSMGAGHVGAQHVPELLRPLKPGGTFVIVLNDMHFESEGFEQAFRELERDGVWQIHRLEQFNYMTEMDRPGWLLVAEKGRFASDSG
ncbi:MAG: class I SAM-dependent DNA methyltransferase [Acidimicrobiales bacterium]